MKPTTDPSKLTDKQIEQISNLFDTGQHNLVIERASPLLKKSRSSVVLHTFLGVSYSRLGNFSKSKEHLLEAARLSPNTPRIYLELGDNFVEAGNITDAISCFKKALQLEPKNVESCLKLGRALQKIDKHEEAITVFQKTISIDAKQTDAYYFLAVSEHKTKNHIEAEKNYKKTITLDRNYYHAYHNLGTLYTQTNNPKPGKACFLKALELKPDEVATQLNLGIAYRAIGDQLRAIEWFKKVVQEQPNQGEALVHLAKSLSEIGSTSEAIDVYKLAIEIASVEAKARNGLGVLYQALGNKREAQAEYIKALKIEPTFTRALHNLTVSLPTSDLHNWEPKTLELCDHKNISTEDRASAYSALSNIYKAKRDLDGYINSLTISNQLRKQHFNSNIDRHRILFEQTKKAFNEHSELSITQDIKDKQIYPVFIVGMPRSGTTLIEQVLDTHSCIEGLGELSYLQLAIDKAEWPRKPISSEMCYKIRKSYLEDIENLSKSKWVTDKMPLNFLWIGFIMLAFPNAKVICTQRDPMAICWSNFKTLFHNKGLDFTFSQEDIANYYVLYNDLMNYWKRMFGNRLLYVNYEKLTENPDYEARKIFKYLNINWEDSVLDFSKNSRAIFTASHDQIRQKIYKNSSKEWLEYEKYLDPMKNILISHGVYNP